MLQAEASGGGFDSFSRQEVFRHLQGKALEGNLQLCADLFAELGVGYAFRAAYAMFEMDSFKGESGSFCIVLQEEEQGKAVGPAAETGEDLAFCERLQDLRRDLQDFQLRPALRAP